MFAASVMAFRLSERKLRALQVFVVLGAAAMSLAVLGQRLAPGRPAVFEHTGIFVNENHFAVFANMVLPVGLALAARARFAALQEGRPSSPAGIILLAMGLLGLAVVLSRSRAGAAVMIGLVAVAAVGHHRLAVRYPFAGLPLFPRLKRLGGVLLLGAAALAATALAREWRELGDARREVAFRAAIVRETLSIWRAQPVWGTGPGTYPVVFPYYASGVLENRTIRHAHCEPVQFLAEFGWAGGLWMAAAAGLALMGSRRKPVHSESLPPFAELERAAFGLSLAALGLHALIDFPLRVPLIAVMAAAWLGVWAGSRPPRTVPAGTAPEVRS
jgi:O-antigen ligase